MNIWCGVGIAQYQSFLGIYWPLSYPLLQMCASSNLSRCYWKFWKKTKSCKYGKWCMSPRSSFIAKAQVIFFFWDLMAFILAFTANVCIIQSFPLLLRTASLIGLVALKRFRRVYTNSSPTLGLFASVTSTYVCLYLKQRVWVSEWATCWAVLNFKFPKLVIGPMQDHASQANHERRKFKSKQSQMDISLRDSSFLL